MHVDAIKPLLEFANINDSKMNRNKNKFIKKRSITICDAGSVKYTIATRPRNNIIMAISEGRKFFLRSIISFRISLCILYNVQ